MYELNVPKNNNKYAMREADECALIGTSYLMRNISPEEENMNLIHDVVDQIIRMSTSNLVSTKATTVSTKDSSKKRSRASNDISSLKASDLLDVKRKPKQNVKRKRKGMAERIASRLNINVAKALKTKNRNKTKGLQFTPPKRKRKKTKKSTFIRTTTTPTTTTITQQHCNVPSSQQQLEEEKSDDKKLRKKKTKAFRKTIRKIRWGQNIRKYIENTKVSEYKKDVKNYNGDLNGLVKSVRARLRQQFGIAESLSRKSVKAKEDTVLNELEDFSSSEEDDSDVEQMGLSVTSSEKKKEENEEESKIVVTQRDDNDEGGTALAIHDDESSVTNSSSDDDDLDIFSNALKNRPKFLS